MFEFFCNFVYFGPFLTNTLFILIQVTASCTSVYVDGSESRGALNAEINIKYGSSQYITKAIFTVWMPETPLNIELADTRLSQIKGWKVPERYHGREFDANGGQNGNNLQQEDQEKANQTATTAAFTSGSREQCK